MADHLAVAGWWREDARQHEQAVVAEKDAFITELKELIEKLESQVQDYRRTKFGP